MRRGLALGLLVLSGGSCARNDEDASSAICGAEAGPACEDVGADDPGPDVEGSTSGTGATTAASGDSEGEQPLLSVLPPYDVLNAQWTYRIERKDGVDPYEMTCWISEVNQWPDGATRSRRDCETPFGPFYTEYAVTADEIVRRGTAGGDFDPPALSFQVPLWPGTRWEQEYRVGGSPLFHETWTAVEAQMVDFDGRSVLAAVVDWSITNASDQVLGREWWVDGIGKVRGDNSTQVELLVGFSVP